MRGVLEEEELVSEDVAKLVREAQERAAYWGDPLQKRTNRAADEYSVDVRMLCDALEEREREVERMRDALRELSVGARSTLSLGYVPADSVTYDELKYGLKLAAAARERAEEELGRNQREPLYPLTKCPRCEGLGTYVDYEDEFQIAFPCPRCEGKGYLEGEELGHKSPE